MFLSIKKTVRAFVVKMTIISIVSQWNNVADATKDDQERWESFSRNLDQHEQNHAMHYSFLGRYLGKLAPEGVNSVSEFQASYLFESAYSEMMGWHATVDTMDGRRISGREYWRR